MTIMVNASYIPRVNTPSPGEWPQSNVTGCGFPGVPYTNVLSECSEALNPKAPDLRGYWKEKNGSGIEYIEQCGSRWIDTSKSVIHDFPECTGVVGDGMGCQDYSAPAIMGQDTTCSPIIAACKFESDETDEAVQCINLYSLNPVTNTVVKTVSRCLQLDGSLVLNHPVFGTVRYEKMLKEEEPNCMKCVRGEYADDAVYDSGADLPCSYSEREWTRCNEEDDEESRGSHRIFLLSSVSVSIICAVLLM